METDFTDVLSYTIVRWFCIGNVLMRVWELEAEIRMFLNMQDISCDFLKEMERDEWVCDFASAVDIVQHMN